MNPDASTPSTDLMTDLISSASKASESSDAETAPEIEGAVPSPPTAKFPKLASRWSWLLLVPLVIAPVFVMSKAQGSGTVAEESTQVQALPVQTQVLETASAYSVERTYTGEIVARRSSNLGFEQAGTLIEILADEGDFIEAGAPLARIDIRSLQAQRQQMEAQKRQATARFQELQQGPRQEDIAAAQASVQDLQAQLDLARLQQQRRENLYTQGAISREELDSSKFSAEALANRLQQAKSQLDELQAGTRIEQVTAQDAQVDQFDANLRNIDVSLSKSVLYAPFSGRVSRRLVDEGVVVGAGQTVLRLVEGAAREARIGVPTAVSDSLQVGRQHSIQVDNRAYSATVTALLPELESTSQTVTVVLTLQGEASPTIGATARLVLTESQAEEGYWVPTNALVPGERGLWSTYVLGESDGSNNTETHQVARRDIEVLYTEGEQAFVRGMLQPGESVITSGVHRVVPGQAVRVQ